MTSALRHTNRPVLTSMAAKFNLLFLAMVICFCNPLSAAVKPLYKNGANYVFGGAGITGPTITAGSATGTISACAGSASASPNIAQFAVSGSSLTADITATAPSGFEVSLATGSGYGSSVTLTQSGGVVSGIVVYVRSAASASGSISGNVSLTSAGATTQNVAVTGMVNALPVVNPVANQTIFNGSTAAVHFTGTANTLNWVNDTPGIGLAASGTGDIAAFTATNTGSSPVTATVTVSPASVSYAYIGYHVGSNPGQFLVAVVNTLTNTVVKSIPIGAGNGPPSVTISPDGTRAYVEYSVNGIPTYSAINTATNQIIPGNGTPPSAISPDGNTQYFVNGGAAWEYHVLSGITTRYELYGGYAEGIMLNNDGSKVFVESRNDPSEGGVEGLVVFNTENDDRVAEIDMSMSTEYSKVGQMVKSPDGSKIYVFSSNAHTLFVVDAATAAAKPIALDHTGNFGGISADGSRIYILNSGATSISVINTITATRIATITVGGGPETAALSPDGSRLYTINYGGNSVSVFNTTNNTVTATIPVGSGPWNCYLSPDGSRLYVANYNANTVSVINTTTNTVIATLAVGTSPWTIAGNADGSEVFVQSNSNVSVINTSTNTVTTLFAGDATGVTANMFIGGTGCSGASRSFTITVNPASSADAELCSLSVMNGTVALSPVFASGTTDYTATVGHATTSTLTITPTTHAAGATIKVNGVAVTSGSASGSITLKTGNNTITVVVTAADGTTTKTYTVSVYVISNNAYLSSLTLSSGTLSPVFSKTKGSYTATVDRSVSSVTVRPVVNYPVGTTVTVNGITVASDSASASIPLIVGANTMTVIVTAQDDYTHKVYTLKVYRAPDLTGLTISSGTLSPAFAEGTHSYTDAVGNSVASVTLTPTASDATATIKVNGVSVSSGTASASVPLNAGANLITVVVTAQDGSTQNTYSVTVIRTSNNAYLASLVLSAGGLSPAFSKTTGSYTLAVSNYVNSTTVTPTVNFPASTVKVNGTTVTSGATSAAIPLSVGDNSITIVVTAQDGVTHKTYTVLVSRNANQSTLSALSISSGTLSPAFVPDTTKYSDTVSTATTTVQVTPTLAFSGATVKVNGAFVSSGAASGNIPLTTGNTTITVEVTAPDGTTTAYKIFVNRISTNAYLSALTLNTATLSPAFAMTTNSYTASVSSTTTLISVTPVSNSLNATIKVNGTTVASDSVSGAIPLVVGTNTITIGVTAQDGFTRKNYTVVVTRPSGNPYLSGLTLSDGTLSPSFAMTTGSYTASVSNATSSITVTPTLNNPNGSIKVNGTAVTSGAASGAIALSVGDNTISTVVTAQDGVTHKTYTVTVTRAMSGFNSLYLPGSDGTNPLSFSLNHKVEANNILSPNGDGINDIWVVKNIAFYPDNVVTVFDREGKVVFNKKGYTNDWAGTYRGSVLNEGTYYYSVDLGNGTVNRGFITVMSH